MVRGASQAPKIDATSRYLLLRQTNRSHRSDNIQTGLTLLSLSRRWLLDWARFFGRCQFWRRLRRPELAPCLRPFSRHVAHLWAERVDSRFGTDDRIGEQLLSLLVVVFTHGILNGLSTSGIGVQLGERFPWRKEQISSAWQSRCHRVERAVNFIGVCLLSGVDKELPCLSVFVTVPRSHSNGGN